jgi:hypothetical protein
MLVLSSSAIAAYKRCPKSYDLGYRRNLRPRTTNEAVERGTDFHICMADAARGGALDEGCQMAPVAQAYLAHKPLPARRDVLRIEEPLYTKMNAAVWIRTTHDLVYRRGTEIIARDYKTFSRAPTLDIDLDYQAKLYIAVLMRHYETDRITWEMEYVRSSLTHANGTPWKPEECYSTVPLVISRMEADTVWQETEWIVEDIRRKLEDGKWYRADLKGFYPGCSSCFWKEGCKAEIQGGLDDQTIDLLYTRGEPLRLPNS